MTDVLGGGGGGWGVCEGDKTLILNRWKNRTYPCLSYSLCLAAYYRYLDAVSLGRLALTSKQMADHVLYHLEDGQNILRLLWCLRRGANFSLHRLFSDLPVVGVSVPDPNPCFLASRIRIHWSEVWIRIQIRL
jgi:hypothetical protein